MHYFKKYKLTLVKETNNKYDVKNQVKSPKEIVDVLTKVLELQNEAEEVLVLLSLDTRNKVIGMFEVSRGSINSSIVHPREILKRALLSNSSNIVIAHNHPSGDVTPSREDIDITRRIKECCNIIGIPLLDHIIVGENSYTSLKEKGII